MYRLASIMKVYPDQHAEYQRRHDLLFPEMREALKRCGAQNYSIFLHKETSQLFAYLEVEDIAAYEAIAQTPECRKWWDYMQDIMETNPDNSPVSIPLVEVFHLD